jgi:gamma-glutamylputrescine oxidase
MASNQPLWAEGRGLSLPAIAGDAETDVCVVGLGGSGLSCIHALLDDGHRVIGIDAVSVAAGAAGRNGGFLLGGLAMFHHDAVERFGFDAATALYRATLQQIDRMERETPNAVRRTGTLRIALGAAELEDCDRQFAAMRRSGLPVEHYRGAEGEGLLFPADAAFDPGLRCRTLAEQALARGAQLFTHSPATTISDGCVETPSGSIRARRVIVTVDGGLERIFPELAPRARTARLQMLATAPAPEVSFARPVYARWGLDYWQQLPDGRMVLGGARDVGGEQEWTISTEPTERVQQAMTELLRSLGVRAAVTHRWAASVSYTTSGLPILEQVRPEVWAAGAYSGTGNVVGALSGRAAAELATRGQSELAALLGA